MSPDEIYETQYAIPVAEENPYPLGRNVAHDRRSRGFALPEEVKTVEIKDRLWKRQVLVYDQGNIGSCTAQAALGCLSTRPFTQHFRSQKKIVKFYTEETEKDDFPGTYPPADTGSDGNTAARVARDRGYITEWRHCFGLADVLAALQTGPLITGTNWYEAMFTPDASGKVAVGGSVAGGHEWVLIGVNTQARLLRATNSWGVNWGNSGHFTISYDDYEQLLHEDGDATVFVK